MSDEERKKQYREGNEFDDSGIGNFRSEDEDDENDADEGGVDDAGGDSPEGSGGEGGGESGEETVGGDKKSGDKSDSGGSNSEPVKDHTSDNPVKTEGLVKKFFKFLKSLFKNPDAAFAFVMAYLICVIIIYLCFILWIFILNFTGGGGDYGNKDEGYASVTISADVFKKTASGRKITDLSEIGQSVEWLESGFITDGSPIELYVTGRVYPWGMESTAKEYRYSQELELPEGVEGTDVSNSIKKVNKLILEPKKCEFTNDLSHCSIENETCRVNQIDRYKNKTTDLLAEHFAQSRFNLSFYSLRHETENVCRIFYDRYVNVVDYNQVVQNEDYSNYFKLDAAWCDSYINNDGVQVYYYDKENFGRGVEYDNIQFYKESIILTDQDNHLKKYHVNPRCIKYIKKDNHYYSEDIIDFDNCDLGQNHCIYNSNCDQDNNCTSARCHDQDISIYPNEDEYLGGTSIFKENVQSRTFNDCVNNNSVQEINSNCVIERTGECVMDANEINCNTNQNIHQKTVDSSQNSFKTPIYGQLSFIKDVHCYGDDCGELRKTNFNNIEPCYVENGNLLYMKLGVSSNTAYHVANHVVENIKREFNNNKNEYEDVFYNYKIIPFSLPTKIINKNRESNIIPFYSRIDKDLEMANDYNTKTSDLAKISQCDPYSVMTNMNENCLPPKGQKIYFKIFHNYYPPMDGEYKVFFKSGAVEDTSIDKNNFRPFSLVYDFLTSILFDTGQVRHSSKASYSSYYDNSGEFSAKCPFKYNDEGLLVPDEDGCVQSRLKLSDRKGTGLFYLLNDLFVKNLGIQLIKYLLVIILIFKYGYDLFSGKYAPEAKDAIKDIIEKMIKISLVIFATNPDSSYFLIHIASRFLFEALPALGFMIAQSSGMLSAISYDNPYVVLDELFSRVIFSTEPHAKLAAMSLGSTGGALVAMMLPVFYFMFISFILILVRIAFGFMMSILVLGILVTLYPIIFVASLYERFKDGITKMIKIAIRATVLVSFRVTLSMIFVSFIYDQYRKMFDFSIKWTKVGNFGLNGAYLIFKLSGIKSWSVVGSTGSVVNDLDAIGSFSPSSIWHFLFHMILYFLFLVIALEYMEKFESIFDFVDEKEDKNALNSAVNKARKDGGELAAHAVDTTILGAMKGVEKTTGLRLEGLETLRNPIKSVLSLRIGSDGKKNEEKNQEKKEEKPKQKPSIKSSSLDNADSKKPSIKSSFLDNADSKKPSIKSSSLDNADSKKPSIKSSSLITQKPKQKPSIGSSSIENISHLNSLKYSKDLALQNIKNINNVEFNEMKNSVNKIEDEVARVESSFDDLQGDVFDGLENNLDDNLNLESVKMETSSAIDSFNQNDNNELEKDRDKKRQEEIKKIESNLESVKNNINNLKNSLADKNNDLNQIQSEIVKNDKKINELTKELKYSENKDNIENQINIELSKNEKLKKNESEIKNNVRFFDNYIKSMDGKIKNLEFKKGNL